MPNGLSKFLFGRPSRTERIERFAPEQQQAFSTLLQMGLGGLSQAQQPFDITPITQRARTQFAQQTIPTILERLQSMGGAGTSPATQRYLTGQAGADLESQLAALEAQVGLQQRGQQLGLLQNLLGLGLQPTFEPIRVAPQTGFIPSATQSLLPILGGLAGSYFGMPGLGAAAGKGISSVLSQFGQ